MKLGYVGCLYQPPQVLNFLPGVDSRLKGASGCPPLSAHHTFLHVLFQEGEAQACLLPLGSPDPASYLLRPLLTLALEPQLTRLVGLERQVGSGWLMSWLWDLCWLATQVKKQIPKYTCVLTGPSVLPHCPVQARLPGAAPCPHPYPCPPKPNTLMSLARLKMWETGLGAVRSKLPSPPSLTHGFPVSTSPAPALACSCHLVKGQRWPGRGGFCD